MQDRCTNTPNQEKRADLRLVGHFEKKKTSPRKCWVLLRFRTARSPVSIGFIVIDAGYERLLQESPGFLRRFFQDRPSGVSRDRHRLTRFKEAPARRRERKSEITRRGLRAHPAKSTIAILFASAKEKLRLQGSSGNSDLRPEIRPHHSGGYLLRLLRPGPRPPLDHADASRPAGGVGARRPDRRDIDPRERRKNRGLGINISANSSASMIGGDCHGFARLDKGWSRYLKCTPMQQSYVYKLPLFKEKTISRMRKYVITKVSHLCFGIWPAC